jgi:hypothetical protein
MTLATGGVAYTGVGFRPTACLFFGVYEAGSSLSIGSAASGATTTGSISETATSLMLASNSSMRMYTDAAFNNGQLASVSSYDADGFTISWTKTGAPTGTMTFKALCFL